MTKTILFYFIFSLTSFISPGQTHTKNIFYGLPLENNLDSIEKELLSDTLDFKTYLTKSHFRRFDPNRKDSVLTLQPKKVSIQLNKLNSDSIVRPNVTIYLDFGEQKQKAIKPFFENLVNYIKSDFEFVKQEYIGGEVRSGKKKRKVHEYIAYFYRQKTDTKRHLDCSWFKTKNESETLIILTYYKDI